MSVQVYRCQTCQRALTDKDITKGGCRCGGRRVSPTNPTAWEALRLIVTGRAWR